MGEALWQEEAVSGWRLAVSEETRAILMNGMAIRALKRREAANVSALDTLLTNRQPLTANRFFRTFTGQCQDITRQMTSRPHRCLVTSAFLVDNPSTIRAR